MKHTISLSRYLALLDAARAVVDDEIEELRDDYGYSWPVHAPERLLALAAITGPEIPDAEE